MKIVYCIHGTFNSGGMEKVVIGKANYLAKKGYEVFIVTTEQKGRHPFFTIDKRIECHDLDINYENENNTSFVRKLVSFKYKQKIHKRRLEEFIRKINPDIVLSTFGNEVNFLYDIKDGSKKILEIHFSRFFRVQQERKGIWKLVDRYRSEVDRKKVENYDRFVVLTHEDKEYWEGAKNIEVIPNFITMQKKNADTDIKRAIAVGRFSYQKGYERMIMAWKKVCDIHPEWRLDIFGNGEEKEKVRTLVDNLGLKEKVILNDATNNIGNEYVTSSVFILSSRYEGLPMVLLEAMSYGLAIVSYDCKCGPKDIIENNRNGILVEEGNVEKLANAIIEVMDDDEKRKMLAQNAKEDSKKYSEDCIMRLWMNLFDNIIKE